MLAIIFRTDRGPFSRSTHVMALHCSVALVTVTVVGEKVRRLARVAVVTKHGAVTVVVVVVRAVVLVTVVVVVISEETAIVEVCALAPQARAEKPTRVKRMLSRRC